MASAIEKLPDINDLLGLSEKAEQDAQILRNMAVNLRHFKEMQRTERLKETDVIPGQVSDNGHPPRTFKEQYGLIEKAYAEKWQRIDDEGLRANVEQALEKLKA